MPFRNGNKLCICEICNCGRHRCPHHPTTSNATVKGPCTISEYSNRYVPHQIAPVMSCKPANVAVAGSGPLSDQTTMRVDYIPHPLQDKVKSGKQEVDWQPPEARMAGESAYQADYTEKRAPRVRPVSLGPRPNRGELGKFVGEPTYRNDYRQWPLDNRSKTSIGVAKPWLPPTQPFEGLATYTSDYMAKQCRPPTSCKPNQTAMLSGKPFDGMTDYRDSYIRHPMQPREKYGPVQVVAGNKVPFEGMTTMQRDYTPKEGGRSISCRPMEMAKSSIDPLTSDTTHRVDYRPLPLQARGPVGPQLDYKPPEGFMDTDTTYLRDYPRHAMPMVTKGGPQRASRWSSAKLGPFEGTTDYRDSYQKWAISPVRHRPMAEAYHGSSVPFEGESTHHAHFIPHPLQARVPHGPVQAAALSTGPFDDATMYRLEYTPKAREPCPAALLETPSARYLYREQDPGTGHKFYEPALSGIRATSSVPVAAS